MKITEFPLNHASFQNFVVLLVSTVQSARCAEVASSMQGMTSASRRLLVASDRYSLYILTHIGLSLGIYTNENETRMILVEKWPLKPYLTISNKSFKEKGKFFCQKWKRNLKLRFNLTKLYTSVIQMAFNLTNFPMFISLLRKQYLFFRS